MKKTLLFLLIILTSSCFSGLNEKPTLSDYNSFLKQVSPDGNYNIYKYCRNGAMSFSSEICGQRIFKKELRFEEDEGFNLNGQIVKWQSKDTLILNRFGNGMEQPKDTIGIVSYEEVYDLTVKVLNYSRINSGGINEYYFDSVSISDEIIKFNGVERELGPILTDTLEIGLGNIKIAVIADSISEIVHSKIITRMDFKYHNSDGSITENLPEVGTRSIKFYPRKKLLAKDYLKYKGIFYEKKTTDNKGYN